MEQETNLTSISLDPRCCVIRTKIGGTLCGRYVTIGHIPREISRYVWWFIQHGGMVDGHVADLNKRQSPIPSGGTEIKLKLYFRHTSIGLVEKLRSLIRRYNYDLEATDMMEEAPSKKTERPQRRDFYSSFDRILFIIFQTIYCMIVFNLMDNLPRCL